MKRTKRTPTRTKSAGFALTLIATALWASNATVQNLVYASAKTTSALSAAPANGDHYANGTYTATGQYGSGPSFLPVTVTLIDGIITKVTVKTPATNPISLIYQKRFADAVPKIVVGKPIADIKVDRLAGSSLTPEGFNAAIAEIRKQASH